MKKPPLYPNVLAQAFLETCQILRNPKPIPLESLASLKQLGLFPTGSTYLFHAFLEAFRIINPTAKLYIIGDSPEFTEHALLKNDCHVEFLTPPATPTTDAFLMFHNNLQKKAIEPWLSFMGSESGITENLQVIDRLTDQTAYFFTPKQHLIPLTIEERSTNMTAQKRIYQLFLQHWQNLPLWEPEQAITILN